MELYLGIFWQVWSQTQNNNIEMGGRGTGLKINLDDCLEKKYILPKSGQVHEILF